MAKRPYVKFYVDDFFGSFKTQGMTTEQIGAYFLMLMAASQEQNIDLLDDDNYLGTITRLGKKFKNHSAILKKCFESENGRIYNVKLRKVLAEYDKFVENQRIKSAKGVSAKQPTGNPQATQAEPVDNPTKTITNNHKPLKEVAKATKKEIKDLDFQGLNEYRELWTTWIEYKKVTFNFNYKTQKSEQIALNGFIKDTNSNHLYAKDVIEKALAEQWKGLIFTEQLVAKWKDRKPNEAAPVTIADQSKIPPHKDLRLLNYVQEQSKQELIAMYGENETELIIAAKTQQGTFYCDEQGEWQMQR